MASTDAKTLPGTEAAEEPKVTCLRREVLAEQLKTLGFREAEHGGATDIPPIVRHGAYVLELDGWERMVLRAYASGSDARGRPWPRLVAEGLAFQMRCIEKADVLEADAIPPPRRQAELVDELIVDAAIGVALLDELQWSINRLIREGDLRVAGRLTEFRNAASRSLARIRSLAGNGVFARAQEQVGRTVEVDIRECWPELSAVPEELQPTPPAAKPSMPETTAEDTAPPVVVRRSRVLPLAITLLVCLVAWAIVASHNRPASPIPTLSILDFTSIDAVAKVEARPPSLYVTLDATAWKAMNELQRWQTLDRIATIASRASYLGVLVRDSEGAVVGRWSKGRDPKVVPPSNKPS